MLVRPRLFVLLIATLIAYPCQIAIAQVDKTASEKSGKAKDAKKKIDLSKIDEKLGNLIALNKEKTIWFEPMKKIVVASGMICLTEGQLEMFACTRGTKEHESIISLHCKAFEIHTALLAIGAKRGKPVVWDPKYIPASGEEIEIDVHWLDEKGKPRKVNAKEWIRDTKTKKKMSQPWVFAGSSFYKDDKTGDKYYMAEGGEVVCLSNFSTAMLDLNVQSSAVNAGLLFEAFPKKIPPLKTPVRLVFRKKAEESKKKIKDLKTKGKTKEKD